MLNKNLYQGDFFFSLRIAELDFFFKGHKLEPENLF